jgi:type IV secretory pathway TraG/TraD family ATPase VirD4
MKIFDLVFNSDLQTKLFIGVSIVVLFIIQLFLFRLKRIKIVFFIVLHSLFGFLLAAVTTYNPFAHAIIYILPSFLLSWFVRKLTHKNKEVNNEMKFTFNFTSSNKKIEVYRNGIFRHFGVFGGTGAGKTKSILKPTIKQMAYYGMSGVIIDYKYNDLIKSAYTHYLGSSVSFKPINTFDLTRSLQCNPVSSKIIKDPEDAIEAAKNVIANLAKESKEGFWVDAGESLLSAVIWKYRTELSDLCYLPYVTATISRTDSHTLMNFLANNTQAWDLAMPYFKAIKSDRTLGNIETTVANALRKISVPKVSWILSGDDIDFFNINNPEKPSILSLSNNMAKDTTYSPIIALILATASQLMSYPNRNPSGIIIDEASRIRLPELERILSTLREYDIFVMLCMQNIYQGEKIYKDDWQSILDNLSGKFFGYTSNQKSIEMYARMYGKLYKAFSSRTKRRTDLLDSSVTVSERQVFIKEPNEFLDFEEGHFFGRLKKANIQAFDETFEMYNDSNEYDIPVINSGATEKAIQDNYEKIINTVLNIIEPFRPND